MYISEEGIIDTKPPIRKVQWREQVPRRTMVNLQLCYVPGRLKILIIFLLLNRSFGAECPASNVTNVKSCPENKTHWDLRANEKRCGSFHPDQTCKLVYHCVLNQWSNGTVEVCAPTWFISGYCAMFSLDERRIKDNFSLDCTKFREPCATRYISTDAYKYKSCYDTISLDEKGEKNVAENKKSFKLNTIVLISTVAVVLLFVVLAIGILILIKRKKNRKRKRNTDESQSGWHSFNFLGKTETQPEAERKKSKTEGKRRTCMQEPDCSNDLLRKEEKKRSSKDHQGKEKEKRDQEFDEKFAKLLNRAIIL